MLALILVLLAVGGVVFFMSRRSASNTKAIQETELDDAIADARRWIERLGSQVLTIAGTDTASTQAIADASERYNAASSQISTATTVKQAQLARESALEGLYYINAAREMLGMPAGPELPPLEGQRQAGKVTEQRTIRMRGMTSLPRRLLRSRRLTTTLVAPLLAVQFLLGGIPSLGGRMRCAPVCGLLAQ